MSNFDQEARDRAIAQYAKDKLRQDAYAAKEAARTTLPTVAGVKTASQLPAKPTTTASTKETKRTALASQCATDCTALASHHTPVTQDELRIPLAKFIADLKESHGWSINDLAKYAGINKSSAQKLLAAKATPSLATVFNLCRATNFPISDLYHAPIRDTTENNDTQ